MKRSVLASLVMLLAARSAAWSQGHRVVEAESNNTSATANAAALGDTLIGSIPSVDDTDFFVLDIPAGIQVVMASELQVTFFDQDGTTFLAGNSGQYSQVGYPFTTAGRYYIRVSPGAPHAGDIPIGPYRLLIQADTFSLEAGDPPRTFARLNAGFDRMAAGLHGELYVATATRVPSDRVLRISPTGDTTTLVSGVHLISNIAVDAFGDVVFEGWQDSAPTALWRVSPDGSLSRFTTDLTFGQFSGAAIAVGLDGDLWVGTSDGITRLDPTGAKKGEVPLKGAHDLVVGPSGELYVAIGQGECQWGIYVVRGVNVECSLPNLAQMVGDATPELAIDRDGALYIGRHQEHPGDYGTQGSVHVVPPGPSTSRPYAHVPWLQGLTFGRDVQGNITSRLFTIEIGVPTRVVELNGASDRPAGAGFNVRFFHATLDTLPIASVGTAYNQALHVTTDATALTWTVTTGALPPGLTLSPSGLLQGTPTRTGSFAFTVRATSGERSWFAPGTIQVIPNVTIAEVSAALLGGPQLDPAKIEFLDQLGNKNGMLDVGDLRAYLRSQGRLP